MCSTAMATPQFAIEVGLGRHCSIACTIDEVLDVIIQEASNLFLRIVKADDVIGRLSAVTLPTRCCLHFCRNS